MKNIVLLGVLSSMLFVGCSFKKIEITKPEIIQQEEELIELPPEVTEKEIKLEEERQKIELKKKLDVEALTNSEKRLKTEEIKSYIIDENTPLILKNQSKDRAYE